jgi:hypothetical protein
MLRSPRLTRASEGNPWRRLLIGSKGPFGVVLVGHGHSFGHGLMRETSTTKFYVADITHSNGSGHEAVGRRAKGEPGRFGRCRPRGQRRPREPAGFDRLD